MVWSEEVLRAEIASRYDRLRPPPLGASRVGRPGRVRAFVRRLRRQRAA